MRRFGLVNCAAALLLVMVGPANAATTTFSNGPEGWVGNADVDASLGAPAPAFHSVVESFGLSWRQETNAAFLGDFSKTASATISLDTLVNSISYLGTPVTRDLFVELVDKGDLASGVSDAVVYYDLGALTVDTQGWTHRAVTISDTSSATLPAGWLADDGAGSLELPPGRTFASVLANVDQLIFTTEQPGYFYGFRDFDVAGDNFTVAHFGSAAPEPATWTLMLAGVGIAGAYLRRRRMSAVVSAGV